MQLDFPLQIFMCSQKDNNGFNPWAKLRPFSISQRTRTKYVGWKRHENQACALSQKLHNKDSFKMIQILSNSFKISSPLRSLVAKTLDDNPSSVDLSFENSSQICILFVIMRHFDHRTVEISNQLADNIIFC